jgi:hypothetical protein
MDLLAILRDRVNGLPPGEHIAGLQAVLQHVVVAGHHLQRGQSVPDDSAFTDVIYRTNQAFEGSLKEAYRILAGKMPTRLSTFEIEEYLQTAKVLRPRLLGLFTAYRKEWRNPSTHDHRLDFDANEALMALVSVAAFAIVLVDQISAKLHFDAAQADVVESVAPEPTRWLSDDVARALVSFHGYSSSASAVEPPIKSALIGTLAGHLSASLKASVAFEMDLEPGKSTRQIDILISRGDEEVIVDVRRHPDTTPMLLRSYISTTVKELMDLAKICQAVVYVYPADDTVQQQAITVGDKRIVIVGPKGAFGLESTPA